MRHFLVLGSIALAVAACGGTTELGKTKGNSDDDNSGGAGPGGGSGGKPTPASGGSTDKASGGQPGDNNECTTDATCVAPADCVICADNTRKCAEGICVGNTCVVVPPECNDPGECRTSDDCGPPPPSCNVCPDGSTVCPGVECIDSQCTIVNSTCPVGPCDPSVCRDQVPGGAGCCLSENGPCGVDHNDGRGCVSDTPDCYADSDCPIPPIPCMPCDDGSCQQANTICLGGSCQTLFDECKATALTWYATCSQCSSGSGGSSGGPTPPGAAGSGNDPAPGIPAPPLLPRPCDLGASEAALKDCSQLGAVCDPGGGCGVLLVCAASEADVTGGACVSN